MDILASRAYSTVKLNFLECEKTLINTDLIQIELEEIQKVFACWSEDKVQKSNFIDLVKAVDTAFRSNGKIIFMGNGGSAAEADHLAAEFIGKCENDIGGLPAISLTSSNSVVTSLANDFSFDFIYSRQIAILATPKDVVIGLSTSGNSKNVIEALRKASEIGSFTSLWTSLKYKSNNYFINNLIQTPSFSTPRTQEHHLFIGHLISQYIEKKLCQE